MKSRSYPITYALVTDHPELLPKIFLKERPHKGVFIGVAELEGCFMCDSPGELYSSLEVGEKLYLARKTSKQPSNPAVSVVRADKTVVGDLPYSAAIIPNTLLNKGLELCAYLEAKSFNAGLLAVAVSVYSEKY